MIAENLALISQVYIYINFIKYKKGIGHVLLNKNTALLYFD